MDRASDRSSIMKVHFGFGSVSFSFSGLKFSPENWLSNSCRSGLGSLAGDICMYSVCVCVIYPSLRSAGPPKSANNSFWFLGWRFTHSLLHSFDLSIHDSSHLMDVSEECDTHTHTQSTIHGPQVPSAKQNRVEIKQIKRLNVTLIYEWFNATHDCASWSIAQVRVFSNSPK